MPQAYAYTRVSTAEQSQGMSLDGQLRAIEAHASSQGFSIARSFIDRGVSGTADDRPAFQEMIEHLLSPANKVEAVIVVHTSRFMRDVELARRYKRELKKRGVRVLAVQQSTTDDENGELMEGIYELFDQHESRIIGARTKAAMMENARQGYFNGALAPFGFQIERVKLGTKTKQRLGLHPEEADVVREIYRRYLGGSGGKALALQLTKEGKLHRGRKWSRDTILKVLGDTCAIGTLYWGLRDSRTGRLRDKKVAAAVDVPPIVDQETFQAVQRLRAKRDPDKHASQGYTGPLLLGGFMRCGHCRQTLQLESSGKDSGRYRYYQCRTFCRKGKDACRGYRVSEKKLNTAFVENFISQALSEARLTETLKALATSEAEQGRVARAERARLQSAIEVLDQKVQRWVDAFEQGADIETLGADRLKSLKTERATLGVQLHDIPEPKPLPPYVFKQTVQSRFRVSVEKALRTMDRNEVRPLLEALVERAEITDGDVVVQVRGAELGRQIEKTRKNPGNSSGLSCVISVRTHVDGWRTRED